MTKGPAEGYSKMPPVTKDDWLIPGARKQWVKMAVGDGRAFIVTIEPDGESELILTPKLLDEYIDRLRRLREVL